MIAGGADAVLVETAQDLLQAKAAIIGAKRAIKAAGVDVPVCAQVTVETTGTMLLGSEIGAALTALEPLGIDVDRAQLRDRPGRDERAPAPPLAARRASPLSCMPNAGLPELGTRRRALPAHARASSPTRTTRFTARVRPLARRRLLRHDARAPARRSSSGCAAASHAARRPRPEPGVASLYQPVPFRQDTAYLSIGERTNANGSQGVPRRDAR